MRAVTVEPGVAGSDRLEDVTEPRAVDGAAEVEVLAVGVDGTDDDLVAGAYGEAPAGETRLIIGHESLGRVLRPAGPLVEGQLVTAIVRRPDPVPCPNCAAGEWDMCLNGRYTELGIKGRHGFLAERFVEDPTYLVPVPGELGMSGVLVEPTSIAAKAIDQVTRAQQRMLWQSRRALVTGAGSLGLLVTALLRLDGLEVLVYNRGPGGIKRDLAERLGATYLEAEAQPLGDELSARYGRIDLAVEATGHAPLSFELIDTVCENGAVALLGVSGTDQRTQIPAGQLNTEMVLQNKIVLGSVNANRRHFATAVASLTALRGRWPGWLETFVTRRVALDDYRAALDRSGDDVKVVVTVDHVTMPR
jgi:threonine dehydrogenase-like Zn-dependent dehydrogenase